MQTRRLFLWMQLLLLYFVQGLPFGFQAHGLPALLRVRGVSLREIGFASALSLPWSAKILIAPLVERYRGDTHSILGKLQRRHRWILPFQLLLILLAALAGTSIDNLTLLMVLVLAMNTCTAVMDISVDGLATDLLGKSDLGHGNAAQVVGFKVGMLMGGGILLSQVAHLGFSGIFYAIAILVAVSLVVSLGTMQFVGYPTNDTSASIEPVALRDVFADLWKMLRSEAGLRAALIVMTYKLGEALIDPMFTPFLLDHGITPGELGMWLGTYGMLASILGSLAGGFLVAKSPRFAWAILICALVRAIPISFEAYLANQVHDAATLRQLVPWITAFEHFGGGMLTTSVFAFMMSRAKSRFAASRFTLLATLEVLGKSLPSLLSGSIVESLGYGPSFSLGVIACWFYPLLVWMTAPSEDEDSVQGGQFRESRNVP